jgi:hypothetical protein
MRGATREDEVVMAQLEVRIDRRWDGVEAVREEISSLVDTARGLMVEWVARETYESFADAAKFRDFAPFAVLQHDDAAVLEWATEELVETFGWRVDLSPKQAETL